MGNQIYYLELAIEGRGLLQYLTINEAVNYLAHKYGLDLYEESTIKELILI
jgi:hypothetical protein